MIMACGIRQQRRRSITTKPAFLQAGRKSKEGMKNLDKMNPKEIKTHPAFENLFPMDKDLLRLIEQDMRDNGFDLTQPIILATWEGQNEPACIDGHTKRQAAINLGIQEVPVWIREELGTEWDALQCAIKLQCHRRNLTDSERINLLQLCDSRRPRGGDRRSAEAKSLPQSCGNESGRSASAKEIADLLGCSPRKVEQLRTIMDHADPDTLKAVQKGDISGNKAYQETQKKRKEAQGKKSKPDCGRDEPQKQENVAQDKSRTEEEAEPQQQKATAAEPEDDEDDEIDPGVSEEEDEEPVDLDDAEPSDIEGFINVGISAAQYEALSEYEGTVEEMVKEAIDRYLEYLEQEQDCDRDELERMWSSDEEEGEESGEEAA